MVIFPPLEHFQSEIMAIREVVENTFEPPHPRNHLLPHNVLLYIAASPPALGRAFPYLSHPPFSQGSVVLCPSLHYRYVSKVFSAPPSAFYAILSVALCLPILLSDPAFLPSVIVLVLIHLLPLIILTYLGKHGKYHMCVYLSALR